MIKYILLGIIQGLTEFFPVSSSAHLLIMQKILGLGGQEIGVSVVLHLGTAFALVIFFFKDILDMLRDTKTLFLIIVVTVITGVIGLAGKDFFERLFTSPKIVALALMVTGIILIRTKRVMGHKRDMLDIKDAFFLGLTQGIAIIPGISRSGITISTLLFRKIDKKTSFRFSFLASIPAVFGAAILEAKKISAAINIESAKIVTGFIFSLLAGILALWILKLVLDRAKLYYFGYYCIIVAIITLIFIR